MTKEFKSQVRIHKTVKKYYTEILAIVFVFTIGTVGNTALTPENRNLFGGGEPTLDTVASMQIAQSIANEASLGVSEKLATFNNETFAAAEVATLSDQYLLKPQLASTNEETVNDIRKHTVKEGESIASLSERFNITTDTIRWVNDIGDWEDVKPGDVLTILPIDGVVHTVKEGESAEDIARIYQVHSQQIISFNDAEVSGLSAGDQIVIPNGILPQDQRPKQQTSQYVHNSGIYECDVSNVSAVERVSAGDVIGYMGSSGISTGKHLHFEICKGDEVVDPVADRDTRTLIGGFIWPLEDKSTDVTRWHGCTSVWASRYSSSCSYGFFHAGIDITDSYSRSTPIIAIGDGDILFKGYSSGYGYNVVIRHDDGYLSRYAHLSRLN